MPLSDATKTALAEFAGLRENSDGSWRSATDVELASTPSPLVDHRDALVQRTEETASFLRRVNRTETSLTRVVKRRTADGTEALMRQILNTPGT